MELNTESTKKIALLTIILGFTALLFFTPEKTFREMGQITKQDTGQSVSLAGIARNVSISKGNIFFELENRGRINAVFFRPETKEMALIKEGAKIRADGKISVYNSKLQIIISKVKPIE
jgi:exonuclease VII large subunit